MSDKEFIRREFKAGMQSGTQFRSHREAAMRGVLMAGTVVIAFLLPFPWWGRVLSWLAMQLLLGVAYQIVELRREASSR